VNIRRRVIDILAIAFGAAMIATLVHIVAILIIPLYATHDAFARLSPLGPIMQRSRWPSPARGSG